MLVGLWLTPFLLRRVGQHDLGLWLVGGQLIGYLGLLDFGVLAILPREVAHASGLAAETRHHLIAQLVARVREIVRIQVIVIALVAAALVWWLPDEWHGLRLPSALVFAAFVVLYPLRLHAAVLQGLQELPFLSRQQLLGWALGSVTTVALVLAGLRLSALAGGWLVTASVPALAGWWYARRHWSPLLSFGGKPHVEQFFQRSMWVSVSQISQVLLSGSDILLVGRVLGAAAVVPYSCTGKLIGVFVNQPHLLMHAAQPALSELRASSSKERLANVATALTHAMLMLSGALAIVVLCVNHYFVNWWVGPAQYGGGALTVALAGAMLLRHCNVAVIYTLFCFGYERQLSLTSLADGVVSVGGAAILLWLLGPIGAPLASIAGVVLVSLPVNIRSVAREMGLSATAFMARSWLLVVWTLLVGSLAAVAGAAIGGDSLPQTLAAMTTATGLYLVAVVPIAWRGPLGPYLRRLSPALATTIDGFTARRSALSQAAGTTPRSE